MKHARLAFAAAAVLVLAACAGRAQTSGDGMIPSGGVPDSTAISRGHGALPPAALGRILFVASANPYFVNAYALPLTKNSLPVTSLLGVNEPVPLAVEKEHLFVGSFDDSAVYRFTLPLNAQAVPQKVRLGGLAPVQQGTLLGKTLLNVGDPSGLAVGRDFFYVAGIGSNGTSEVLAYKAPIVSGEMPSATIEYKSFDFIGIATANDTLYAASVNQGTVRAYSLPLSTGESPLLTIHIPRQSDAAIGVAASPSSLYVTNFSSGEVVVYPLPYKSGESPTTLDLKSADGGNNPGPYGIAVDRAFLYVTAGPVYAHQQGSVFQYRLPIVAGEKPAAILPFDGLATGVAVWPKWPQ